MPVPPISGRLQWTDVPTRSAPASKRPWAHPSPTRSPRGRLRPPARRCGPPGQRPTGLCQSGPDDDPLTAANLHEAAVLSSLPPGAPAPGCWAFTAPPTGLPSSSPTSTARTPTSPRPTATPNRPGRCWTSSPPGPPRPLRRGGQHHALHHDGPARLGRTPPRPAGRPRPAARALLPELAEREAAWPGLAYGDRIVHGDLRADNMVRDHHLGVTFVDWAHATTGPACIDAASLAPSWSSPDTRPWTSSACSATIPPQPTARTPPPRSWPRSPATGTTTPASPHPRRTRTARLPTPRRGCRARPPRSPSEPPLPHAWHLIPPTV
ncbi:phosphotransferase [Streptomyces sp. M10(2022)]